MTEVIIEKLLEQRDFYLYTLKHLEFQSIMDPSEQELEEIKSLQVKTIDQLKLVEKEIAYLSKEKTSD